MSANPDFRDLFKSLNAESVEYLVVGAHAVMFYAEPRFTKDLDIWVNPNPENAARVFRALSCFGAPLQGVKSRDFTDPKLMAHGTELWVNKVVENKAPDAVAFCWLKTGGRTRCKQIILIVSQGCLGFKGIA